MERIKIFKDEPVSYFDRASQVFANYVHDHGLKKVMLLPYGAAPVLVAVGVLPVVGSTAKIFAFFGGFVFYTAGYALLLRERQILKLKSRKKSEVLNRYMNAVHESQNSPEYFKYLEWDEEVSIDKNGSAEIFRWCTIQVGDKPIDALWGKAVKTLSTSGAREKNRPSSVECDFFHAKNDTGSDELTLASDNRKLGAGALITEAKHTLSEGEESTIYVYFEEPLAPGEVVRLRFYWKWPRFSEKLFQSGKEPMYWILRQQADTFKLRMSFDKKCNGSKFRISPLGKTKSPQLKSHSDGQTEILLNLTSTPVGQKFGFILDASD
ncbi:hypothetical protein [Mycobacteroides abscessus]|uniref:hypothetical protein n=1 Tax=Mycobacteroides abscessus TaxID=36809 RepID=UPI0011C4861D|nr:hypothetical protein [Mycobacteroides abscessus]